MKAHFSVMIKLLDFYATWCGPCQAMKPVIKELEAELAGKIEVVEIDVDENPDESTKHGVMSIPTFIVLKEEKEVGRKTGATSRTELLKLINS